MSFTSASSGITFNAGSFLVDDETCLRESMSIAADHPQVVEHDGKKTVSAGAIIPSNDENAKGILYEDIDVTNGSKPGSVIVQGTIYGDLLPDTIDDAAASAMKGITIVESPTITRPY